MRAGCSRDEALFGTAAFPHRRSAVSHERTAATAENTDAGFAKVRPVLDKAFTKLYGKAPTLSAKAPSASC